MTERSIAIVGCGLIGRSFSMLFASAGYKVFVYDIEPKQLEVSKNEIWRQLVYLEDQGLLRSKLTKEQQFENILTSSNLRDCVCDSFYVLECVPEILETKRQVWSELDKIVHQKSILSSSTSSLLPSAISDGLENKNRFIVTHPTNPPYYAPATEVVPSSWTDPDVVTGTMTLLKEIGQVPILIKKEVPAFALNRIQYAILGECYRLVKDGVVSPQDCDLIMTEGLGLRYAFIGMYSFRDRYSDVIFGVQKGFGPPERMEGPALDAIQRDMEKIAGPVDGLPNRRRWRDQCLVALAKLKRSVNTTTEGNSRN